MSYTDQEMRNFTQVAYADFSDAFKYLSDLYPERKSFTIAELEIIARQDNAGIDLNCLKCLTPEQKNTWSISGIMDSNQDTGFYACVIETAPGEAAVAFRGSEGFEDPSNLVNDWLKADIGLLNSTETNQHAEINRFFSMDKYNKLLNSYDSLTMTGHSLGGNLAEYATIVSRDYGLDDNITRCVSFDGPGFSDEFIGKHAADIYRMKDKMTHYRWSLVGGMLFELPGVTYVTCSVSNEANTKDGEEYGILTRHDTKYLEFDENGNVVPGRRDITAWIADDFSKHLDSLFSLNPMGFLMMPFLLVQYRFSNIAELFHIAADGMVTIYRRIKDAIHQYLNRNNVYFRVNTSLLLSDTGKISSSVNRVRNLVSEMFDSVQQLNGMWKGPANAAFAAKFAAERTEIDRYLDKIRNYVDSVESDAGAYDNCERRALETAASLGF